VHLALNDEKRTYTILDEVSLDPAKGELSPNDPLASRLIGLKEGDRITIQRPYENLVYEVTNVQSKYVYAYQQTLADFPTMFPSHLGIQRMTIKDDDFSTLLRSVDERHEFVSLMSAGELRSFLGGLHPATLASGRHLVDRFDFSTVRSLLDVGGGSGGLAIAITEACPQLHATVLEIPTVAPITQEFVNEAGASDRIDIISEDVINGSLSGSYEVACLASFLQVLSPADASLALRNIYDALEPNGVVYIVGRILDDSRVSPTDVVGFNLVFISIYDEGQAYTEQEHRD